MSESGDYNPAPWAATTSFKSARAEYDTSVGRAYDNAVKQGVTVNDLVPASITTLSTHPALVPVDLTGSMDRWPNTMFEKLGFMEHELRTEYLGEDGEVSFGGFADVHDQYPLQIQPFAKGEEMPKSLKRILLAGGGSGSATYCEAYAVAALYYARNVHMPNAVIKSPLIFIGDEMPDTHVSKSDAKAFAKVDLEKSQLSSDAIFAELMHRFSVYLILKPYGGERLSGDKPTNVTARVYACWEKILGVDRIALLADPARVVDVIFGILAKECGRVDYFRKEIEGRQDAGQVSTVYESLKSVHNPPTGGASQKQLTAGQSTLHPRSKKP